MMLETIILNISFHGFWMGLAAALLIYSNGDIAKKVGSWLIAHSMSIEFRKTRYRELIEVGE